MALLNGEDKQRYGCDYLWIINKVIDDRYSRFSDTIKEDLYFSGLTGICKALNSYDTSRGVKFSTYAYHIVAKELSHCLHSLLLRSKHFVDVPMETIEGWASAPQGNRNISDARSLIDNSVLEQAAADSTYHLIMDKVATDDSDRKMVRLLLAGKSIKEIAKALGCTTENVIIKRKKLYRKYLLLKEADVK